MTEYLYDRDNPKSNMRQRLTGIEGFFYGVPNINERAENPVAHITNTVLELRKASFVKRYREFFARGGQNQPLLVLYIREASFSGNSSKRDEGRYRHLRV